MIIGAARFLLAAFAVLPIMAAPGAAQDREATLADIRQQLSVFSVELQRLKRELSTTGSGMSAPAAQGALARLDAIEGEMRRLTAKSEELEFRIDRIVEDGTNRLADLEFRLHELGGGDLSQVPDTPPLGGEAEVTGATAELAPAEDGGTGAQMAVGEAADFEAALGLLEAGTPADALAAIDGFLATYPRSPLAAEAQFYRGEALQMVGNPAEAGRAYLESYTLAETGNPGLAADALLQLGITLSGLGDTREACLTISQIPARFPGTAAAAPAGEELERMSCP